MKSSLRYLRRNPAFTAVAVLTLALGIGANTAVFSVINAILLRPLPYPHPERLVTLWESSPEKGIEQDRVSGPNYLDWREQNTVFADLGVSPGWRGSQEFNLVLGDFTVKISGTYASASLFSTLGVNPLLGRVLVPDEDQKGGPLVAVLSHGLWKRHFGGDSNVLGRTLTVDTYGRRDYTIVGVMPPGFGVPGRTELWLPLGWMDVSLTSRRSAHWHNVVARLKPGVTRAQARSEMNAIQARLRQAHPAETIGTEVDIVPLLDQALGRNIRTALWMLWGVVAGVLLIACANIANLTLARATARQKEIALRLALGAGRWRVIRQLLAESVLLACVGGALGVLLAWWGVHLFVAAMPDSIPRVNEVTLDAAALGVTLLVSVATGVLFGMTPAWQCSRPDLNEALKEGARAASPGKVIGLTRNALVTAEVALSVVLLTGAALMLQSFARMVTVNRGFQSEHLVTAELDFSVSGFTTWVRPTATRPQVPLKALIERLRLHPGVQTVGAGSMLLRRENRPPNERLTIFGRGLSGPEEQLAAEFKGITPEWIRTLGGRVLRGRDFTEADTLQAPGVVLVNETFVRRYFPNENPIGQRLRMGTGQAALGATNVWGLAEWSEIIGVVSDVTSLHPQPQVVPEVFQSYWQWPMQSPTLLVRTTGDPAELAEVIRRETRALIPNLPSPVVRTMEAVVSETIAHPRLQTALLSLFAGVALVLAAVGLYGVLAYVVAQRTQEIGIRMALGARRANVLSLIIGQGMKLAVTGLVLGIAAAFALTRLIRSLLYGIEPTDPFTFIVVSLLLLVVALVGSWFPARRATKIHPMEALRTL